MPSRRMIDPAFWQSESVAQLPIAARYFFIGLFSNADDQGRMRAHPALIRSKLYPYDDISLDEISAHLELLVTGDFVILYQVEDRDYLQIANWWKYQRPRWAWPSDCPAPEGWADRVHYRQGNAVIKENWDEDGTEPEAESDDSGPTVEPQRPHGEPTAEPAPRDRDSISTSISTSTRDSEDLGADAPPPPDSPKRKRAAKPKTTTPPAVQEFRKATHRYPNKSLWDGIAETVGDDPTDVERFGKTALAWVAMGWNPTNVKGMLQHFVEGRIPGDDSRTRGSPGQVPEPKGFAAVRAVMKREGMTND